MIPSMTLNNQIYNSNNDGYSDPEGGVAAMASVAELQKQKQQLKSLEIIDTEVIFLPSGGNITV